MLESHAFCDSCPGCRPALTTTGGRPLPADSPEAAAVAAVWDRETTYAERKAFIEVTLHNSRAPEDLALCARVIDKFKAAFAALPEAPT